MTIKRYLINQINENDYKQIYKLNYRTKEFMMGRLTKMKQENSKTDYIYIVYDDDKIVGWSMLLNVLSKRLQCIGYFYVRKVFRNSGIGSMLMNAMIKDSIENKRYIYVHYDQNVPFFNKFRNTNRIRAI